MLYIHSLMGDARPGEADPNAIGPEVASIFRTVAAESARLHGPYRVEGSFGGPLKAGEPADATIRLVSASGAALPERHIPPVGDGCQRRPEVGRRQTPDGAARSTSAPPRTRLDRRQGPGLASTLPSVYRPTVQEARRTRSG